MGIGDCNCKRELETHRDLFSHAPCLGEQIACAAFLVHKAGRNWRRAAGTTNVGRAFWLLLRRAESLERPALFTHVQLLLEDDKYCMSLLPAVGSVDIFVKRFPVDDEAGEPLFLTTSIFQQGPEILAVEIFDPGTGIEHERVECLENELESLFGREILVGGRRLVFLCVEVLVVDTFALYSR